MDSPRSTRAFLERLDEQLRHAMEALEERAREEMPPGDPAKLPGLLRMALRNEAEAFDLAARWLPSTPEIDVKLGFARQAGDEAKHYERIAKRLREMGDDLAGFDPLAGGPSPLTRFLRDLETTAERLAAGQFTREAIALRRNVLFLRYLDSCGDEKTARLYREVIQPDEEFHHTLGRRLLERHAIDPAHWGRALAASARTLELAEELRGKAARKTGVCELPGC